MRLDDLRGSSNIENQRGMGGGGGGGGLGGLLPLLFMGRGLGLGGVILLVILAFAFGINPFGGGSGTPRQPVGQQVGQQTSPETAAADQFVARVLETTETTWSKIFAAEGQDYPEPTLVLYDGFGQSGCGAAQAATGPFYCPADRKVYLDTSFFDELSRRFGAPGDFAAAYVIAHEVGHHIQTVTGVADQVRSAQAKAGEREANALQVRMELQADCYAGLWGRDNAQRLEPGDIEEAMRAAESIGDDTLQRQSQGRVVPDSFTHGSSEQRMRWFMAGYQQGSVAACDTFNARTL
ncbi:neutral zinc metallopeptidase [Sphingoaurantiacus capsulatus]|uniref:Neutral zinc metallopeptidase n=1 Tax=Sphingoaurantiacus capsulatus TaxID=1771310 RepID=A0ABV7XFE6_9SPHN